MPRWIPKVGGGRELTSAKKSGKRSGNEGWNGPPTAPEIAPIYSTIYSRNYSDLQQPQLYIFQLLTLRPEGVEAISAKSFDDNGLRPDDIFSAAKSGAVSSDSQLGRLIDAWLTLSIETKAAILSLLPLEVGPHE